MFSHRSDPVGEIAFDAMQEAFQRASSNTANRITTSECRFGESSVRFQIVGDSLAGLMQRPFRHLIEAASPVGSPALRIDLWHEAETGEPYPVTRVDVAEHIEQSTAFVEFGFILGNPEDRFVGCQRPQLTTWCDRERGHWIGCVSSCDQLSLYDRGKPLHYPLLTWHNDHGRQVVHSALISGNGGGALLVGKGGVGKTTVALACLSAGFRFLGDDYIAIETSDDPMTGYSLYSSAWIMMDHLNRFPELRPFVISPPHPEDQKALLPIPDVSPELLERSAPIRVLILPRRVEGAKTSARPARKSEALLSIAPSSMILLPGANSSSLNELAGLVDRVPTFWLEFDQDLDAIPACVESLIGSE